MSVELDVEIVGFEAFLQQAQIFETASLNQAGEGLVALAKRIVNEIKEKYVPVDVGMEGSSKSGYAPLMIRITPQLKSGGKRVHGGTLRDSVNQDEFARFIDSDKLEVSIWAGKEGSGAEKYAAIQHENLLYRHQVGQAKYIEIPVMLICPAEMAPEISKHVQIAMSEVWG